MKNFGSVGERYCPAQQKNVPIQIWWDEEGNRNEECLHCGSCDHQSGYSDRRSAPCGGFMGQGQG